MSNIANANSVSTGMFEKYKKVMFVPLSLLSLVFLYLFVSTNFHLQIAVQNQSLFEFGNIVVWGLFALDYLVMFVLSPNKLKFVREHKIHLLVVFVPFLRVLRIGLLIVMLTSILGQLKNRILISVPIYTFTATTLFTLIGAASVFDAEYQSENGNIKTPQDAMWWAAVTIFTVGYGDKFPVTGEGRIYGVGLMLCGIAIVGTVTATFAGWLISQIREVESENNKILNKLEAIEKKLS